MAHLFHPNRHVARAATRQLLRRIPINTVTEMEREGWVWDPLAQVWTRHDGGVITRMAMASGRYHYRLPTNRKRKRERAKTRKACHSFSLVGRCCCIGCRTRAKRYGLAPVGMPKGKLAEVYGRC